MSTVPCSRATRASMRASPAPVSITSSSPSASMARAKPGAQDGSVRASPTTSSTAAGGAPDGDRPGLAAIRLRAQMIDVCAAGYVIWLGNVPIPPARLPSGWRLSATGWAVTSMAASGRRRDRGYTPCPDRRSSHACTDDPGGHAARRARPAAARRAGRALSARPAARCSPSATASRSPPSRSPAARSVSDPSGADAVRLLRRRRYQLLRQSGDVGQSPRCCSASSLRPPHPHDRVLRPRRHRRPAARRDDRREPAPDRRALRRPRGAGRPPPGLPRDLRRALGARSTAPRARCSPAASQAATASASGRRTVSSGS